LLLIASIAAPAQVDFTGEWAPIYHEDQPERIPGPEIGDYLGLPINDALRLRADSWDADIQTLPERQCIPHPSTYSFRGPANLRVSKEVDPVTQDVVSYTIYGTFGRATRVIWMDGRPHPSEHAAHTWAGFSTGKWEGNFLTVETTHIKAGYIRRNGAVHSDLVTMTEHFIRHGDVLTIVTIDRDPVYLTEPFIRTTDFLLDLTQHVPATPCDVTVETVRPHGGIPHHLPGGNNFVAEFADRWKLPFAATRGGAETTYPEYRGKLAANAANTPPLFVRDHVDAPGAGRSANPDAALEVIPVRGNVYMLVAGNRNVALSVGPEGVLLVDAGLAAQAGKIAAAIAKLSQKPIRYIIDTNADDDHIGGNAALAKLGRPIGGGGAGSQLFADLEAANPRAEIISHVNVWNRMREASADAQPSITYSSESKELFFNDEAVQILHQSAAHSDGDSVVFFRRSDVLATGDLFDTTRYPVIDLERGGGIQGEIDGLNRILDLTIPAQQQEGGTMVIPGQGRLCDEADVVEYRDMVTIIRDRVQDLMGKGMTLEQVIAARPTRDYDGRYGATTGSWTTDMFVSAVYKSLAKQK
jgi:glyoxylase-like metal-dependent hydrolase (beta-lactamase superfamily II)